MVLEFVPQQMAGLRRQRPVSKSPLESLIFGSDAPQEGGAEALVRVLNARPEALRVLQQFVQELLAEAE
jgi:hypothetical protein